MTVGFFPDFFPVQPGVVAEMEAVKVGVAAIADAIAVSQTVELGIRQRCFLLGESNVSYVIAADLDAALDAFGAEVLRKYLVQLVAAEPRFAQGGSEAGVEGSQTVQANLQNVWSGLVHGSQPNFTANDYA